MSDDTKTDDMLEATRAYLAQDRTLDELMPSPSVTAEAVRSALVEALSSCKFMSHAEAADALLGHPVLGKLLKGER